MIDDEALVTLSGRYMLVPNPCTTEPCLPGMAYAVEADGQCFFLVQDGRLLPYSHAWNGWAPAVADVVSVTGAIRQQIDVRGNPYFTIEVIQLASLGESDGSLLPGV